MRGCLVALLLNQTRYERATRGVRVRPVVVCEEVSMKEKRNWGANDEDRSTARHSVDDEDEMRGRSMLTRRRELEHV